MKTDVSIVACFDFFLFLLENVSQRVQALKLKSETHLKGDNIRKAMKRPGQKLENLKIHN